MTAQVADVAFEIGIAPDADESVHAVLIDDARVGLGKRLRPELHVVEHREVLEALGAEQTDAPARENVIEQEGRLAQSAGGLHILEVEVFETAESAGLYVAPAVDQTEIELAFLAARVVTVLALRLHGAGAIAAEGREERSASVEIEIAGASGADGGSDVHAHDRKFLVAFLTFVHRADGFGVRDLLRLRGAERLRQSVHLIFQRILLVAQIAYFAAQLIVLTLQVLQLGENVVQLVEPLENLRAAFFLLLGHVVQLVSYGLDDIADTAFLDYAAARIAEGQDDAAVHEPAFFRPVVHFRCAFAVARSADLVVGYAVLHQERFHGIRPFQRELFVVSCRTHVIRVSGDFHPVIAMLTQQVRQPQKAGISVRKNRRIEFEINLFPIVLGLTTRV